VSPPHVDLALPDAERAILRALIGPWRDLLYAPGPDLTSPLDPGAYRSSVVIVPAEGPAVRVSSLVAPAFGDELCRLRIEALPRAPGASLGSFFDLARTGTVYALTAERGVAAAARAPERAEWRYGGPSLAPRLTRIRGLRLLRERGRGMDGTWLADRGLAIAGTDDAESLLLAVPEPAESALFLPAPGLYRALLDPAAGRPGVTISALLGHADRAEPPDVTIESLDV
jgi:hypothetical protein